MAKRRSVKGKELTHEDDPLLTCSVVGKMCGKHRSTIGLWVKQGLLPAIKLPSGVPAIRLSDVDKFLGSSALPYEAYDKGVHG